MRAVHAPSPFPPYLSPFNMATNVRNIQQKLFRSEPLGSQNVSDSPKPDNPLTISIPKTVTPPPSKVGKLPEPNTQPTSNGNAPRPYRDRLRQDLGSAYKSVEHYRLDQDGRRERHWKRWGPYVSDRQWVRRYLFLSDRNFCAHCPSRRPSGKTILRTATHGHTFPMSTLAHELIGGERMASQASVTTTNVSAFLLRYGTRRIECSRKGSLACQAPKEIMERMSRSCITTWIPRQLTHT